jgi:hypothetical protein
MLHVEQFDGGVVQTKNQDTLAPGELSAASNMMYVPSTDNFVVAPSLASPETFVSGTTQFGAYGIKFDNGNNYILTENQTNYTYATLTPSSGAFGNMVTLNTHASSTARKSFTAVQYDNRYYLMDGVQRNLVLDDTMNVRLHGLKPVRTPLPAIVTATAADNVWPALATGIFDYWYTEVYINETTGLEVESAYEATSRDGESTSSESQIVVTSVSITDLKTTATIRLPGTPTNSETTHYRVYRSAAKNDSTEPGFPNGSLIAEVKVLSSTTTSSDEQYVEVNEGITTTSGWIYPAAAATATDSTWAYGSFSGWGALTNATGSGGFSDSAFATATASFTPDFPKGTFITFSDFNITSSFNTEPVTQFEIEVKANIAPSSSARDSSRTIVIGVQISVDGGTTWTTRRNLTYNNSANGVTTGLVSWGRTFTRADILNANFKVRLAMTHTLRGSIPTNYTFYIDGLRIRAIYGNTGGLVTKPYPGIVITQGSKKYVCSRNGQPPIASVGTIFQGSLLVNDVTDPSMLRWSIPGDPEAYPSLYYLNIETPQNDKVTFITTVNNVCIVGLENNIIRLNYLPSEDDSNFERDKIFDFISTNLGIVNSKGAVTILTPTGRELLACLTTDGIYVTDGYTINKWDTNFDWVNISLALLATSSSIYDPQNIQLSNDPGTSNLILAVRATSSAHTLHVFNYSPRHLMGGSTLKYSGYWTVSGATNNGLYIVPYRATNGTDFLWFINNTNSTSQIKKFSNLRNLSYTPATANVSFTTRQIFFNQDGEDSAINYVYLHNKTLLDSNISVRAYTNLVDSPTQQSSDIVPFQSAYTSQADLPFEAYLTKFQITCSSPTLQQFNRLTIDFEKFGR